MWNNGPMTLGASTEGRGAYRVFDASVMFLDGFLRHESIRTISFAIWCSIPVKVHILLAYPTLLIPLFIHITDCFIVLSVQQPHGIVFAARCPSIGCHAVHLQLFPFPDRRQTLSLVPPEDALR